MKQALLFGGFVFGINLTVFYLFVPFVFKIVSYSEVLIRAIVDIGFVIAGIFVFEKTITSRARFD